jgi:nucleoside-diphosphate-sugar epimerase
VDMLLEDGHDVVVVDNLSSGKEKNLNPDAVFHHVDVAKDFGVLKKIFRGADGVFHLAAIPRMQYSIEEPRETHVANINGTFNVLEAAKEAGIRRVVYSASSSAYGTLNQPPFTEDMAARPVIPYAIQKYVGELYCRSFSEFYGLETVCLRYFNVYGPRQTTDADGPYATVIGIFLGQRVKGQPMTIVPPGTQRRDFTHVNDVARANVLAMLSPRVGSGEVVNTGTGVNHSVLEVAALIGGNTTMAPARQGEAEATLADISQARELLGWMPGVAFEDGIKHLKRLHGLA